MKKILLLATVMMLFAAVGLVADVSFGGFVRGRAAADVDSDNKSDPQLANVAGEVVMSLSGDYNVGTIRLNATPTAGGDVAMERAHFTTNVGNWLAGEMGVELPVGITNQFGWQFWAPAERASNSMFGFERYQRLKTDNSFRGTNAGNKLNISIPNIGNVYFLNSMNPNGVDDDGDPKLAFFVAAFDAAVDVGVGNVFVELLYSENGAISYGDGDFFVGLGFGSDTLMEGLSGKFGLGLLIPLADDTDTLRYGVGASIGYLNLVDASISYRSGVGDDAGPDAADSRWLGLGLTSDPMPFLGIGSGLLLNLSDEDTEIEDVEIANSAQLWLDFKMGAATYTVGYTFINGEGQAPAHNWGPKDWAVETGYSNLFVQAQMSF